MYLPASLIVKISMLYLYCIQILTILPILNVLFTNTDHGTNSTIKRCIACLVRSDFVPAVSTGTSEKKIAAPRRRPTLSVRILDGRCLTVLLVDV